MSDEAHGPEDLLARLRKGDPAAATEVFNRFTRRLIALARSRFDARLMQKADPEDVVQSVFRSFFVRHLEDDFEVLDWHSFWSLLAMITVRKCVNLHVYFNRQNRAVGREIVLESNGPGNAWEPLAREPTPYQAAMLTDITEHLLNSLSPRDRQIVGFSLEGKSMAEISQSIGRAERTVRRTLDHFRQLLESAVLDPASVC